MTTAQQIRMLFREYATCTPSELAEAAGSHISTVRAYIGTHSAASRTAQEFAFRGNLRVDPVHVSIMRKRLSERAERAAA
jgi:hypothetical protein